MDEIYNREYYQNYCGPIPYEGSEHFTAFFRGIAERIVTDLHPKTVLDAGCAVGYLVAALRDMGVEAYGVDISQYAISKVRDDIKQYCKQGSICEALPEGLPIKYDLVVNIELLEHIGEDDGKRAIANLCSLTDCIVFSSTPSDHTEETHINVQQREYWAYQFALNGFADDLNYRPTYITHYAACYRSIAQWPQQVEQYERFIRTIEAEMKELSVNNGHLQQAYDEACDRLRKSFPERIKRFLKRCFS